jgi:hypothetical protein
MHQFGMVKNGHGSIRESYLFRPQVGNGETTLIPHMTTSRNNRGHSIDKKGDRENQFRSLYSFQTFKWLILQTQAHTLTVENLSDRVAAMENTQQKLVELLNTLSIDMQD